MSQPIPTTPSNRRHTQDRRADRAPARRAPKPSRWARWLGIAGRDLLIIIGTLGAIIVGVRMSSPIFANHPKVVEGLTQKAAAPVKAVAKAVLDTLPKDTSLHARLVGTPQFEEDRKKFAGALVATGRVPQARADSIAYYAVRESYVNHIPPAVVFGVMLTENSRFISGAMSNVGAVGLMQVYPKVWLKALSSKFGKDLATDSTNIKYGVYILKTYVKTDSGAVTPQILGKGLLRYNGCVRGTNTPHCKTYPNKVKTYVEKQGTSICGDKDFYDCIAKPFVAGLFGKKEAAVGVQ
jgi:hypothetical protein